MKQSKILEVKQLIHIFCVLCVGLLFGMLLIQMPFTGCVGADDWEHWGTSWFMYHGHLPYRDFFQHHNPLLWYLEIPFFSLVDHPLELFQIGRIMAAVFFLGGCFFIGKIVQALGGGATSFLYALLVYFSYPVAAGTYIQNRPDTYMVFCMLAGCYYWIRFYQGRKEKDIFLCYLLFFLSFAFLQKAVWLLVPFGLYQVYLLIKSEVKWSSVIRASVLPLLLMLGYGIYLYVTGSLARYWELNWILNLYYFRDYQTYFYGVLDHEYNFLCFCLLVWGVLKGRGLVRQLSIVLSGFGLIYFFVPKPYPFYWLIWTPFAAIALGFGIEKILKTPVFLVRIFGIIFLLLSCFLSGVYIFTEGRIVVNEPFKEAVSNLEKHYKPGDDLVDYGDFRGVFFRTKPAHYYWYNLMRGALWDSYLFHKHELPDWDNYIYRNKPKYIIYHDIYNLMHVDDQNTDHKLMGVSEEWLVQNYRYLDDCDTYERLEK